MKKTITLLLTLTVSIYGCVKWKLEEVERLAILSTINVSNISYSDASVSSEISFDGDSEITLRGVCWSTNPTPTLDNNATNDGSGIGSFNSSITGLNVNTTYYVRSYAINSTGTSYGNQVSFTTPSGSAITTATITNITETTANGGGNVSSDGGDPIIAKGLCWGTNQSPSLADNFTSDGIGLGAFSSAITGLTINTTYYARAYATNSLGVSYGNTVSFTTIEFTIPELTTSTITNITQSGASTGGLITSDGGTSISVRGVCWSTNQNPTITDNYTTNGSGIGSYNSSITGLTQSTTYYARAYATNSIGTAYGNEVNFTTLAPPTIPILSSTPVSNITISSATSGGTITSDGGAPINAKGVCWSTNQNPTIADYYSSNGSGASSYSSSMTGLSMNTTYYVRAYATNSVGTAYGDQISFTTTCNPPTVVIQSADYSFWYYNEVLQSNHYNTNLCGMVTNTGGGTISAVNIWFNQSNPPNAGGQVNYGGLNTPFCGTPGTAEGTYYLRVSATSGCGGTGYSNIQQIILP
jgi:hypothetical protein